MVGRTYTTEYLDSVVGRTHATRRRTADISIERGITRHQARGLGVSPARRRVYCPAAVFERVGRDLAVRHISRRGLLDSSSRFTGKSAKLRLPAHRIYNSSVVSA